MTKIMALLSLIPVKIRYAITGFLLVIIEGALAPLGSMGEMILSALVSVCVGVGFCPSASDAAQSALLMLSAFV
jgi:hypothetical protein